jgi:hypothetical protein
MTDCADIDMTDFMGGIDMTDIDFIDSIDCIDSINIMMDWNARGHGQCAQQQ